MKLVLILSLPLALAAQNIPKAPAIGPGGNVVSPDMPFKVTLNYVNTSCTSAKPCLLQVFRSACITPTNCPPNWIQISSGSAIATPSNKNTTWVVIDSDPSLSPNTAYFWRATNSYQKTPITYSPYSPAWKGVTGASTPSTPIVGVGNSVN